MVTPNTKYTKSGDINIAYQVFGSGPVDLVYIPGWVSNIDWMWACPELVYFFTALSKMTRVILFDKRGTGLSDRVVELSTLEERMEDIEAVMNAAGSEKAILFGHSEGGSVSALFSVTYPSRVISLMAFGIFAKRTYSPEYPWAPTDQEREKLYAMIENSWGSGEMNLETLAPSKAKDIPFMNWLASYFRSGASPKAALKLTKMNTEVNIMGILKYIKVPTLLMQRTHDIDVKIEEGKFISQHIRNAKFVEFDGADHLFWAGNTLEILKEMKSFIKTIKPNNQLKKELFTLLFGQLTTTPLRSGFKFEMITQLIKQYAGKVIRKGKNEFLATFEVPGKAVSCSLALQEALKTMGMAAAMGICMKEITEDGVVITERQHASELKSIRSQFDANQILITPTVKNLLSGAPLNFIAKTAILAIDSLDVCKLYSVSKMLTPADSQKKEGLVTFPGYTTFLEDVLHTIDQHMENPAFNIEMLSNTLGLSERQLQRRVKKVTGKSPSQLIMTIRLKKAKEALLSNILTVSEIAFQYGFTCPSYFSKCFKKEFGKQPTSLLQKIKVD